MKQTHTYTHLQQQVNGVGRLAGWWQRQGINNKIFKEVHHLLLGWVVGQCSVSFAANYNHVTPSLKL